MDAISSTRPLPTARVKGSIDFQLKERKGELEGRPLIVLCVPPGVSILPTDSIRGALQPTDIHQNAQGHFGLDGVEGKPITASVASQPCNT